jgi:hypothetical protein
VAGSQLPRRPEAADSRNAAKKDLPTVKAEILKAAAKATDQLLWTLRSGRSERDLYRRKSCLD